MQLKNMVICITGATAGIGEATARMCAQEGATLVLTGRRRERLEALAASLKTDVHLLPVDIRDWEAMTEAFTHLPDGFKEVDVLVNNAGLSRGLEPFHQLPLEDIEQMVDTNIKGMIYATRLLLPGMVARDRGHIVNLGSIAGNYAYPGGNVYAGTKGFVKQFSMNLRADLLGKRVRVTNVEPGACETEFSLVRYHGDKERAAATYAGMQPLTGEDIADAIVWCITRPPHVNVNRIEIMPVSQATGAFAIHRE